MGYPDDRSKDWIETMKTFDEAVTWARGKHAEAVKMVSAFTPTHVNKRKPVTPKTGKTTNNGKANNG